MNFLVNLVKVFPNLKTRPLHLTGESYAGTYIVSNATQKYVRNAAYTQLGLALHHQSILWHAGSTGQLVKNCDR